MTTQLDHDVDWLAVTLVAVDGHRMHLTGRDRQEALRAMYDRGVDQELMAARLFTNRRAVEAALQRLNISVTGNTRWGQQRKSASFH